MWACLASEDVQSALPSLPSPNSARLLRPPPPAAPGASSPAPPAVAGPELAPAVRRGRGAAGPELAHAAPTLAGPPPRVMPGGHQGPVAAGVAAFMAGTVQVKVRGRG
jgi:hypothetical protein